MDRKTTLLLFLVGLLGMPAWSQLRFFESTFNGGIVGGGYSVGSGVPSGSGSFDVSIPAGSTIHKAYLFAGRCGNAPSVQVSLNGNGVTFNSSNEVTSGFFTAYGGLSSVNAVDVTALINPSTSSYTIAVPTQNLMNDKFADFYLYIAFENASLPPVTSAIFLNTESMNQDAYSWSLSTTGGINTSSHVGLAIFGGYAEAGVDCENVSVSGIPLGAFGGQDYNGSSAWGVMAGFQYYNNTLQGYNDDNADSAIDSTDALANIQGLVANGTRNVMVDFTHCTPTMDDNHVWALFLTHGSGVPLADRQLDLHAVARAAAVQLRWSIGDNAGVHSYELQRSQDGVTFTTLHTQGAKPQVRTFEWEDATAPVGQNWYRVRALDHDGTEALSDVKMVVREGQALAISLGPNPVSHTEVLRVQLGMDQPLNWTLYQPGSGSQVLAGQHSGGDALEVPTKSLAAGSYALQLRSKDQVQVMRFVVN
jgi:hypothetical protein